MSSKIIRDKNKCFFHTSAKKTSFLFSSSFYTNKPVILRGAVNISVRRFFKAQKQSILNIRRSNRGLIVTLLDGFLKKVEFRRVFFFFFEGRGGVGCGHSAPGSEVKVSPSPVQDTAAALGMWLEDRRARDTSTVARFWGPRLAGDALPGLKPWQGSPPALLTIIPPPPPFFSMARPHTWFTRLLICSCWGTRIKKKELFIPLTLLWLPLVAAGGATGSSSSPRRIDTSS